MLRFQSPSSVSQKSRKMNPSRFLTAGRYEERCPSPEPSSTPKSPVNEPSSSHPSGAPSERDAWPLSFPPHILPNPQQRSPPPGSPNRATAETDAPYPEPSFNFLSKFPVNGTPPHVPQRGPYGERETPFYRTFFYVSLIIHLSLKVHGKGTPLHVPQQGRHGERCSVSRANGFFINLYPSESPVKEPSHDSGENIRSPSTEPHADPRPTCSIQHNTFHLGLGRPEPR
jgi:hypothetical protein